MKIQSSSLPDVKIISPEIFRDDRGFFYESYRLNLFSELCIPHSFVQDNHSGSRKGILRGLHYQIHQPQGKLLGVIVGKIYDVVVDLRESSETFGKWIGIVLSSEEKQQLWVPPGYAHGFYVLSDWAEIIY
jgi:dTDP-4-dehydrorhamnose 3,5-epimerase